MDEEEQHKEFLLTALRGAITRAKLIQADLETIGVALKGGLINSELAVKWIYDANLLPMVGAMPEGIGKMTLPLAQPEKS